MKLIFQKPDTLGAVASSLCVVHCLATPLLFVVHSCTIKGCDAAPVWWKSLDFIFLAISFMAIYRSSQTTSKKIMKYALWLFWSLLFLVIVNEKIGWVNLPEIFTYFVALSLSGLHIYNLRYCQCQKGCCIKST